MKSQKYVLLMVALLLPTAVFTANVEHTGINSKNTDNAIDGFVVGMFFSTLAGAAPVITGFSEGSYYKNMPIWQKIAVSTACSGLWTAGTWLYTQYENDRNNKRPSDQIDTSPEASAKNAAKKEAEDAFTLGGIFGTAIAACASYLILTK